MGLEVVVSGEDFCADQFLLKDVHEVQKVFRAVVADVVYGVWWDGKAVLAVFLFWCALHNSLDAFYDIVYISEVALAVSIVEDLDGLALAQLVGKAKVGHVGPARRAIDRKETQSRAGDVIELGIGVGHELVALLGGGVEGDGVVHLVLGGIGHLLVAAIN